jgi:hypothetical protein
VTGQQRRVTGRRRRSSRPQPLERPKVTAVVDVEIRLSARHAAGLGNGVHDSVGRILFALALAKDGQSLVDENPDQPAPKSAFIFKVRRIARCCTPAVFNGNSCSFVIAQYTAGDEVK